MGSLTTRTLAVCLVLIGCGDDHSSDAAVVDVGADRCQRARDCDDGTFCNGRERCDPSDGDADERGCLPADSPPCLAAQTCSERDARCVTDCAVETDADGDGVAAIDCGGSDCDDADARRAPGFPEICDDDERDEDCDPATVGDRDADGDGDVSAACCNTLGDGTFVCGPDCDDTTIARRPGQLEICDDVDNDCDGLIDEEANSVDWYPDVDGDGFGSPDGSTLSCVPLPMSSLRGTDCDDADRGVNPIAAERCNGIDDNCDGEVDEGCAAMDGGTPDAAVTCTYPLSAFINSEARVTWVDPDLGCELRMTLGSAPVPDSLLGLSASSGLGLVSPEGRGQLVSTSAGSLVAGRVRDVPADSVVTVEVRRTTDSTVFVVRLRFETGLMRGSILGYDRRPCAPTDTVDRCDGIDADCDGAVDEDPVRRNYYVDGDGDGAGTGAARSMTVCSAPGFSTVGGDCDDFDPMRSPLLPERCSGVDDNCDGRTDEEPGASASCAFPGTSAACVSGTCSVVSCTAPWADCDGNGANGCERNTDTDPRACGACGSRCADSCAGGACSSTPVTFVTASSTHACVSRMSGRVACWGSNSRGQLGDGTTTNAAEPTLVVGITDAAAVTAGDGFTCARRTGGTVSCWGGNWAGMLGLPTSVPRSSTPRAVSGLSGVVEVSAGTAHACARLTGGAVRCWGDATSGFCGRPGCRLGDGGGTAAGSLSTVAGLADAAQVAAAEGSTCARRAGGSVVCWGDNGSGQLGDGTTTSRATPRTVAGLTDAAALAAGARHVCATRSGGTVVCWGDNARGQLGDGTTTSRSTPGPVIALGAAVTLLRAGGAVSAARLSDGRLLMWGGNVSNSFGPAVPPADHSTPVPSTIPTPLSRLAPADALTCGTFADGRAFCYGDDSSGQRGDGADDDNIVNL